MRKLFFVATITFLFTSCSKEWSVADQNQYKQDCIAMAQGVPNGEEICDCGLQKAMKNYKSMDEAKAAVQAMNDEEVETFFAECM